MIIDTIENASTYFNVNPDFKGAFEFINGHNGLEKEAAGPVGTFENLTAFVATFQGVSKEPGLSKFECHDTNIDIQYCIKGKETFGWKPRHKMHDILMGIIIRKKRCDFSVTHRSCYPN